METRPLGNTGYSITRIGFGTWALGGGDWVAGWGDQDDRASIAAILRTLERGINWIDTAPVYGLGRAEEVVARALAEWRGPRPYVFTKCSMVWDAAGIVRHSLKCDSVRRECEASLRRLRVDVLDLVQIHWPVHPVNQPAPDIEEGWTALAELQREGKIRHIGVSNFGVGHLERCRRIGPVASNQPPYSVIRPGIEADVLPYCAQHGIAVLVYSPMQSGLLSGAMTRERIAALPPNDWRSRGPEFAEPNLTRNLRIADVLRGIGKRHGCSPGEVAITWTLRHPAVTAAIVGGRNAAQVDGFVGAAGLTLTTEDLSAIESAHTQP